jgi:hypothetical protein
MSLKEAGRKIQILKVHCLLRDLFARRVNSFSKEIVENPSDGWDEPYIRRWVIQTVLPLPNCIETVKGWRVKSKKLTKPESQKRQFMPSLKDSKPTAEESKRPFHRKT